jgi:muramoyltetrapeptide carboxypeptidase
MILPNKLNKGDTIGVVAPSNPIINENIDEIKKAKEIIENKGFKVKFSKNLFLNTNGYSATAKEKAQDINEKFLDMKDIIDFFREDKINICRELGIFINYFGILFSGR